MDAAYLCDQEAGEEFDDDGRPATLSWRRARWCRTAPWATCQKALDADPSNRHLMYNLAEATVGRRPPMTPQKAQALLYQAAQKGSAAAMYAFGIIYSRGEGATRRRQSGAAVVPGWGPMPGNAEAMSWIGMFDSTGRAGPVDMAAGLAWNQRAADKGVPYAMGYIASMYYYGNGVTQDTPPRGNGTRRRPTRASSPA
ncbi:MAG: hypothetical protein WDN06_02480 [Asticcacaulis sp.]